MSRIKRIVFTGYRGTGKSSIGKRVARTLGVPFLDTDVLVEERAGKSIPSIFCDDGEARFREYEREVIASLPGQDVVIGTGGGVVTDPANMEFLRADSACILLSACAEAIAQRLEREPRPPLTGLLPEEEIREMLSRRREAYRASADFCIDTSTTTADEAADRVLAIIRDSSIPNAGREIARAFFSPGRLPVAEQPAVDRILADPGSRPDYDPLTRLLGVAGFPAGHSKSPKLFNTLFTKYRLNCHYTRFEHTDIGEILKTARAVGVKGLSVTIPFKTSVIPYLDEVDAHAARQIGAVNTVIFACGTAIGYNTDWMGIRQPLEGKAGSKAVLLGAGGVAAGAAFALLDLGMDVTLLNRTEKKAETLAGRLGCSWAEWDAFNTLKPDIVVNATPLGMFPDTSSPLSADQLHPEMTVFDLVYTPPVTPLIAMARKAGCETITGTDLFVIQAKEQFRLFFGIDVPLDTLRELVA
ncbi:MAG: shikimate dehydrogenase [Methanoregula sp.]|jgi:shikimate dehydrogenase